MLAVTFHTSGGHGEAENVKYLTPPEWGETLTVKEYVYVVDNGAGDTPYIWVEMDVLTCLDAECDMSKAPAQRFQMDDQVNGPWAHVNYGGGMTVTGVTTSCSPTHPQLAVTLESQPPVTT